MSFKFNWSACKEESFATRLKGLLTDALKSSAKPSIIIDDIIVKDLVLGDEAPKLEILDIGDVADDRFRGIFKLNYEGNASITLATTVEANPLRLYEQGASSFACPSIVAASDSLPMPLNLSLSNIKLSGIIILVFSKAKGLTLVFRNDPLETITVSSSLDSLPMIANFLQVQIENVIRGLFREQLPGILHRLSQRYTPEGASSSSKRPSVVDLHVSNKPINFNEINPDLPEFSLSNMLKLETMCASQRTLNIFTPSIPDAVYRSNLDVFDGGAPIADQTVSSDLADVYKAYQLKSTRKIKPRRRVIKLNGKSQLEEEAKATLNFVEQEPAPPVHSKIAKQQAEIAADKVPENFQVEKLPPKYFVERDLENMHIKKGPVEDPQPEEKMPLFAKIPQADKKVVLKQEKKLASPETKPLVIEKKPPVVEKKVSQPAKGTLQPIRSSRRMSEKHSRSPLMSIHEGPELADEDIPAIPYESPYGISNDVVEPPEKTGTKKHKFFSNFFSPNVHREAPPPAYVA